MTTDRIDIGNETLLELVALGKSRPWSRPLCSGSIARLASDLIEWRRAAGLYAQLGAERGGEENNV